MPSEPVPAPQPAVSTASASVIPTSRGIEAAPADARAAEAPAAGSHASGGMFRPSGLVARSLAEAAGTFLLVFAGLSAVMLTPQGAIAPPLVFGLALTAGMLAFGGISGGHFNPAVSLGSAVAGGTGWGSVLPYVAAQVLGGAAAAGLMWLILAGHPQLSDLAPVFSAGSNGFEAHSPVQFPLRSAVLAEAAGAALLTAVVLGSAGRAPGRAGAAVAAGLGYAVLMAAVTPVTNGSLNPARSTASALFAETWALQQLWLFWAAPVVGALITGVIYRSVLLMRRDAVPAAPAVIEGPGMQGAPRTEAGSADERQ